MTLDELVQYIKEELEAIEIRQSHYEAMLDRLVSDVNKQVVGKVSSGVQMRINDSVQLVIAMRTANLVMNEVLRVATGEKTHNQL